MLSLGFMTLNLSHEDSYLTEIAKRAKKHDVTCFRFIPSAINPLTEKAKGERFDVKEGRWIKSEFPIPDILYDRCFYGGDFHSKQCMNIVSWLKTRSDIQFLGFGLPNKFTLYKILSQSKLAPYLPNTEKITSSNQIIGMIQNLNPIIIKPVNGSQGNGIYLIEKQKDSYLVRTDKKTKQVSTRFSSELLLSGWLKKLLLMGDFIIQPYLSITNEFNQPFDIRALLQVDPNGEWVIVGKGVRVGKENGIISNLSAGASVLNFNSWLYSLSSDLQNYVAEEITDILRTIPNILEKEFPPLFELGIDIGIAKDNSIWILDVNSKPGRKVILEVKPESKEYLYESPILFAKAISNREFDERRYVRHEESLSDSNN